MIVDEQCGRCVDAIHAQTDAIEGLSETLHGALTSPNVADSNLELTNLVERNG